MKPVNIRKMKVRVLFDKIVTNRIWDTNSNILVLDKLKRLKLKNETRFRIYYPLFIVLHGIEHCESAFQVYVQTCLPGHYRCEDGTCILVAYHCDDLCRYSDIPRIKSTVPWSARVPPSTPGWIVSRDASRCITIVPRITSSVAGGCVPWTAVCDWEKNRLDSSDEAWCSQALVELLVANCGNGAESRLKIS